MRSSLFPLLFALATATISAREPDEKAKAALEKTWQQAARQAGLGIPAIRHLEKEKVLMVEEETLQSFQAYLPNYHREKNPDSPSPDLPYFITTDAMFQAYAWCLQKCVAAVERSQCEATREMLETLLRSLEKANEVIHNGDPALIQAAHQRAQFVIAVAATLMDIPVKLQPQDLQDDVEHTVTRIRLAMGSGRPARLKLSAESFSDLDYTAFKPVSFYADDPDLAGYFRAVRWLQLVPFRTDTPEDLLAIAFLRVAIQSERLKSLGLDRKTDFRRDEREYTLRNLAGPADRLSVFGYLHYNSDQDLRQHPVEKWIRSIADEYKHKQKPSHEASAPHTSTLHPLNPGTVSAHVLPGVQLLDAQFIETLSRHHGPSYLPDALSIAAWLGSTYAAEQEAGGDEARKARQESPISQEGTRNGSLHEKSLALLQRLFEPLPADAPAFMKTRAWQAKSCQTALSAWTQLRHVWALQSRPQYSIGAGIQEWPAFIEPLPDFFSGLADLCQETLQVLRRAEVSLSTKAAARHLRHLADNFEKLSDNEAEREQRQEMQMTVLEILMRASAPLPEYNDGPQSRNAAIIRHLRESADIIERGEASEKHPVAQALLHWRTQQNLPNLDYLEKVCLQLALLSQKQSRGLLPRPEERDWLRYFGVTLSGFTDSHFTHAQDDVPKAARIFTNPALGKALTAGIGRPRFIYVLYPWQGREILCRGAVLPYLESTVLKPWTDAEWKSGLRNPTEAPVPPSWLQPLTGTN